MSCKHGFQEIISTIMDWYNKCYLNCRWTLKLNVNNKAELDEESLTYEKNVWETMLYHKYIILYTLRITYLHDVLTTVTSYKFMCVTHTQVAVFIDS